MGLGYVGQKSVGIKGVTVEDLMDQYEFKFDKVSEVIKQLNIDELLKRDINYTLSGGEIKRVELFTLSLLENIHTYLLDELDSGVDLENIGRISEYLKEVTKEKSMVITTHTGAILKELDMDTAYVMLNGEIVCKGKPKKVWECINKQGYENCLNCEISEK
jgi:Fe-S cluster assembly ATP-binding protein